MKKLVALLLACMLILAAAAAMAEPSGTVMLYSSLKEKQLVAVKEAFEAKYPGIVMDYYQAGTGKIKTKIATEQQAGGRPLRIAVPKGRGSAVGRRRLRLSDLQGAGDSGSVCLPRIRKGARRV